MTVPSLKQAIMDELDRLAPEQQQKVLDYAQLCACQLNDVNIPQGVSGESLLPFGGAIDKDDLEKMKQAIEED